MSTLQPGDGYTFSDSSSGFTLDINKAWTPPQDTGFMLGFSLPKFPDPPQPPDPPSIVSPNVLLKPLQFQCNVLAIPVSGTPTPVVQVAMGSVTYTHSTMPYINTGAFTDHRQAYINFVAVKSADVTPVPLADATSPWMLGGGGYALTGTGRWFVTLSKWDAGNGAFDGGLLDQNLPWVSFVKEGSAEFNALFVDAGPSLYQNTTNIQRMEGYDDIIGPEGNQDWGHCHTTYFNPRFFGYHVRVLAIIDSMPATPFLAEVTVIRPGGPTAGNEIQQITYSGAYNSGTNTFSYNAATTTTSFNPSTQSAYDLQLCLNTIPALSGNVFVQQAAPGVFQVEFTNILRNTDVSLLVVNASFTSFTTWYKVYQMHVGSQDIVIPCELNATFLMNKPDLIEAGDPYYANRDATPAWNNVVNNQDAIAANALGFTPAWATPVIDDTTPRAFTTRILNYAEVGGCTPDAVSFHPFQVILDSQTGTDSTYSIISGTVNNLVPNGVGTPITVATGAYYVYLKLPFVSPNFPANNTDFKWEIAATMPADTDAFGYVKVADINPDGSVTQFVTGSLWADRIKLGSATATYYYARI